LPLDERPGLASLYAPVTGRSASRVQDWL